MGVLGAIGELSSAFFSAFFSTLVLNQDRLLRRGCNKLLRNEPCFGFSAKATFLVDGRVDWAVEEEGAVEESGVEEARFSPYS